MSLIDTLNLYRRGRTVSLAGEIIGTIDGTSLANLGFRGSKRPILMVRVRRTDGGRQTNFGHYNLKVVS